MQSLVDNIARGRIDTRRAEIASRAAARVDQAARAVAAARRDQPMGFAWVTHCLAEAAGGRPDEHERAVPVAGDLAQERPEVNLCARFRR